MTRRLGPSVMTIGAVLLIIGSFAPWLTSLGVSKNSWDLRDFTLGLGYGDNGAFEYAVVLWVVVPLAVVVAAGTAWRGRLLTSAIVGGVGALYAGVVALAVLKAPDIRLFEVNWGVGTTFGAAVVVLAAGLWQIGLRIVGRAES